MREAIGKDVSLMLDLNAPYDVDGCIEFARRVEPLDIYWLEEPLHWYVPPADFVRLAAATSIPLGPVAGLAGGMGEVAAPRGLTQAAGRAPGGAPRRRGTGGRTVPLPAILEPAQEELLPAESRGL